MRSDRLLEVLDAYDEVVVVSHDNPDPDAIATGWALSVLVKKKLEKPVRVLAGGAVERAENIRMIELLKPPIRLVDEWNLEGNLGVVFVDCTPVSSNHILVDTGIKPAAVLDHHEFEKKRFRVSFRDIRPRVAALASMATEYLREQKIEPSTELATALLYAIRTETVGWQAIYARVDRRAITWLTDRCDPAKLNDITNAALPRPYFGDLLLAIESTFIYEDAALCFLPRAHVPEIVGEVADLLIRCGGIHRVLCAALFEKDLLISARSSREGGDAVLLLEKTLKRMGTCGGHRHRAGGKVAGVETRTGAEELQNLIRNQWLAACGIKQSRGTRLVAKKEIVGNL